MAKVKSAELRPLKSNEKLESASTEGSWKQRPSKLALLSAVMNFVGGFGRGLEAIEKFWAWWNDIS